MNGRFRAPGGAACGAQSAAEFGGDAAEETAERTPAEPLSHLCRQCFFKIWNLVGEQGAQARCVQVTAQHLVFEQAEQCRCGQCGQTFDASGGFGRNAGDAGDLFAQATGFVTKQETEQFTALRAQCLHAGFAAEQAG